jgi:hypothetical protein
LGHMAASPCFSPKQCPAPRLYSCQLTTDRAALLLMHPSAAYNVICQLTRHQNLHVMSHLGSSLPAACPALH